MSKSRGLYVSTDGKIDPINSKSKCRYVIGTSKQFNKLLTGNENKKCESECLYGGYKILYNNASNETRNKFVSRYVENTEICGPVIIIKEKGDIELDAHKTLGKNILRKVDWIGFTIPDTQDWTFRSSDT
jgi:hypothetical protein